MIEPGAEKRLLKHISGGRRPHSLRVAKLAAFLADREGADPRKAYLAGLLHDCAKSESVHAEKKDLIKYRVTLTPFERRSPELWHAKAGAKKAALKLKIKDREVIEAVSSHTTGSPEMAPVTKALYIADFAEEGRKYKEAHNVRKMALKGAGFKMMVSEVVREKVIFLMRSRIPIHEQSLLLLEKTEQK